MMSRTFFAKRVREPGQRPQPAGFTLVELLVVIGLIVILTGSFGVALLNDGSPRQKVQAATGVTSTLLQGARAQAILNGEESRLIIHADPADPDKFLRFIGVVFYGEDAGGNEGWIASGEGEFLPNGIYFNPTASTRDDSSGLSSADQFAIQFPRRSAQTGGGETFYYFEFNSNGTTDNAGSRLVFSTGEVTPTGATPVEVDGFDVAVDPDAAHGGIVLQRFGSVVAFPNETVLADAVD